MCVKYVLNFSERLFIYNYDYDKKNVEFIFWLKYYTETSFRSSFL